MVELPQKITVDALIVCELGVEGSGKHAALFHEHRQPLSTAQHPDAFAYAANDRGTDEHHLNGMVCQLGTLTGLDRAVHLPAICIALNADIDQAQTILR